MGFKSCEGKYFLVILLLVSEFCIELFIFLIILLKSILLSFREILNLFMIDIRRIELCLEGYSDIIL